MVPPSDYTPPVFGPDEIEALYLRRDLSNLDPLNAAPVNINLDGNNLNNVSEINGVVASTLLIASEIIRVEAVDTLALDGALNAQLTSSNVRVNSANTLVLESQGSGILFNTDQGSNDTTSVLTSVGPNASQQWEFQGFNSEFTFKTEDTNNPGENSNEYRVITGDANGVGANSGNIILFTGSADNLRGEVQLRANIISFFDNVATGFNNNQFWFDHGNFYTSLSSTLNTNGRFVVGTPDDGNAANFTDSLILTTGSLTTDNHINDTGPVTISTGRVFGAGSSGDTGNIIIRTGENEGAGSRGLILNRSRTWIWTDDSGPSFELTVNGSGNLLATGVGVNGAKYLFNTAPSNVPNTITGGILINTGESTGGGTSRSGDLELFCGELGGSPRGDILTGSENIVFGFGSDALFNGPNIKFNSAGLGAANNGYVWTLVDDSNGLGEWQQLPSDLVPSFATFGLAGNNTNAYMQSFSGIASNITGFPLNLTSPEIVGLDFSASANSTATIEIYEHDGNNVNLVLIGSVVIPNTNLHNASLSINPTTGKHIAVYINGTADDAIVALQFRGVTP